MNVTVTTEFAGTSDTGDARRTIRVFIDDVLKFVGTFDSEAEAFQEAQKWFDDHYPDSGVTL